MRFVIVTGMSGAGKSTALKMLEDAGYFCVDNLPVMLMTSFAKMAYDEENDVEKVAVGIDVRSGREAFSQLKQRLNDIKEAGYEYEILFLDSNDQVLLRRYKETRRNHPLGRNSRIETGIKQERELLNFVKKESTYILDTSTMLTRELKRELDKIFVEDVKYRNIFVTILSFGFKYGIPGDSDLVFDVRFLPNPYYIPELKRLTGNDKEVQDYVMQNENAQIFLDKLVSMCEFLIPQYQDEGKYQLVISIGCTGGKHRSVTLANELYQALKEHNISVKREHRDIEKDAWVKGEKKLED